MTEEIEEVEKEGDDGEDMGEEVGKDEARKVKWAIVQGAVEVEVKEVKEDETLGRKNLLFLCCVFLL